MSSLDSHFAAPNILSSMIQRQELHTFIRSIFQNTTEQIAILDKNSKFISLNEAYAQIIGYKKSEDALGLSYDAFRSDAADKADVFCNQDKAVLQSHQTIEFLSYHRYADGDWHLLYGEKNCLFDEHGHALAVFSRAKDVSNHGLIDLSRFLIKDNQNNFSKLKKEAFTYYIKQSHQEDLLTRCELECLFLYIRGKTSQDISNILHRSKRTIDMHLEAIKNKFNVHSKPQLIEKAITEGYMSMLPESLFYKLRV